MDKSKLVITIERQYGSGGRIVGKKLAEELGISFYDDEILSMTAEKSAVGEKYFRLADEKAGNNLLRKIVGNLRFPVGIFEEPKKKEMSPLRITCFVSRLRLSVNLLPQSPASSWAAVQIIFWRPPERRIWSRSSCMQTFPPVYAELRKPMASPIPREALNKLNRITKQRKSYHKYFTGKNGKMSQTMICRSMQVSWNWIRSLS
ncbi:MAG: cytidylate kinase-like family protein [Clostridium sp.]